MYLVFNERPRRLGEVRDTFPLYPAVWFLLEIQNIQAGFSKYFRWICITTCDLRAINRQKMTYLGLQQYANEVLERFSLIERAFFGNNCDIQVYETETMETKNCCLVCYICHNQVVNIQHLWQRLQSLLNIQLSSPNGQIVPNANQITSMIHEYDSRFKEFIFMQ